MSSTSTSRPPLLCASSPKYLEAQLHVVHNHVSSTYKRCNTLQMSSLLCRNPMSSLVCVCPPKKKKEEEEENHMICHVYPTFYKSKDATLL
ncbi:hypothetical protein HBH78_020490 [Parastagonospora nodorum]|nr:hypothetical protein HBH78_020490 [Parastagonospora nodorum]KAH5400636.1 hypothetical protein HBI32_175890 [Parastagonospora nodorum]